MRDLLPNVKIAFWGTPAFTLPSLEALVWHGWRIGAVITNPDEPAGRRHILTPPPVKIFAATHHIPVLQPENPSAITKKLRELAPDIFVVTAYGKMIPKEILEIPKYGALNLHPSLLPRWRGPSPIQFTILNGDTQTGVSIIKMDERMDRGPIVAESRIKNQELRPTYKELHDCLSKLGAELLIETLSKWIRGEITPVPQDESRATYSKLLTKDNGRIDWKKPAEEIERMIRALNPWPGAWTLWPTSSKIMRVKIIAADVTPDMPPAGSPGYVWRDNEHPLLIKTGSGSITIQKLGVEGKKILDSDLFIRGQMQIIGATFI